MSQSSEEVLGGFDESLFRQLSPPFPKVELERFDGSMKGDIVSLKLNFIFFSQEWTSEIIEHDFSNADKHFIDKGIKLPFFLSFWMHRHEINRNESGSTIVDHIEYKTGTLFTDLLFYPAMLGQFLYRKPIYKRFFR